MGWIYSHGVSLMIWWERVSNFSYRIVQACPCCAGPGCGAARRAAVKSPSSRPCRAVIPYALTRPHRVLKRAGARRLWPMAWSVRSLASQAAPASLNAIDQMNGLALPTGMGSAARSRDQGTRALFLHAARERARLTNRPRLCVSLRFACWGLGQIVTPFVSVTARQARCRAVELKGATSTQKQLRLK